MLRSIIAGFLVVLLVLLLLVLVSCGGSDGPSQEEVLRQQVADGQSTITTLKMLAIGALIIGGLIGLALGGRDES